MKSRKRDSYKYINSKRKAEEMRWETKDMKKAEVFGAFFYLRLCWKEQPSGIPRTRGEVWTKEYLLSVEVDQVRKQLNHLDTHISSWGLTGCTEKTPENWKKASVAPIFRVKDSGKSKAVSLMSNLGKVRDEPILETISILHWRTRIWSEVNMVL